VEDYIRSFWDVSISDIFFNTFKYESCHINDITKMVISPNNKTKVKNMKHHCGCGPRGKGPHTYTFKFGVPPMFFHGMGGFGGFDTDLLETKEDAQIFMKRTKKHLDSRKAGIESHLKKLSAAIERVDSINSELAQNENYDAKEFQKILIKEFKKFMISQIDEE
jgi:hypothetical protein